MRKLLTVLALSLLTATSLPAQQPDRPRLNVRAEDAISLAQHWMEKYDGLACLYGRQVMLNAEGISVGFMVDSLEYSTQCGIPAMGALSFVYSEPDEDYMLDALALALAQAPYFSVLGVVYGPDRAMLSDGTFILAPKVMASFKVTFTDMDE